jgi:hypothetical protein
MQIQKTGYTIQKLPTRQPQPAKQDAAPPQDSFTFSGRSDNKGWKVAGISLMLASVPIAIASRSVAVGAIGALAGVGLMFGPDD